jgi:hypothetical protein
MSTVSAPAIFKRGVEQPLVSLWGRLLAAAIAAACLGVLGVAAWVHPSTNGYGTHHDSLGMASCAFLERTNLPCPSCGMTTSFAHFVRGNVVASLYVQPMGTVLAILTAACFWVSAYIAITAKPVHRLLNYLPGGKLMFALLAFGIVAWAWKILIHLRGIDGWR